MTNMIEVLSRSRAGLDPIIREALEQGRTVRSRNRDGEYAIVLSGNPIFTKRFDHVDGIADSRADWTIAVPDFTLRNVAKADENGDPELWFFAPVLDRAGDRVGTIRVNGSPYGKTATDQGMMETATVFFTALRAGDLFRESETDGAGRMLAFRATAAADSNGRVVAEVVATGEERIFDLGPDYLVFKAR
jgi:hypothetical protein